ncbi:MAG: S8 family serine peptidase [Candidatus Promineifilaceae bacterium]|nr:S8 family serine peptidase [Candidatus Promineifilaceae bacterium]
MKDQIFRRRAGYVFILFLALSLLATALASAAPAQIEEDKGQPAAAQPAGEGYSHRLIVELESPPLAAVAEREGLVSPDSERLNVVAPEAQTYVERLQAEQAAFISAMEQAMPSASVAGYINELGEHEEATYQVVFNGVAVDPGMPVVQARKQLAQIDGVKAVYLDHAHEPQLYASLPYINVQSLWDQIENDLVSDPGEGILVASMDGGVHHDAAMFDGTGYTYPTGFGLDGLGDPQNNNGKIVASRAYFRDWDPPSVGDENTWPGENGTSHGVHTASTAGGNEVVADFLGITDTISGVAPNAWIMSYRVFYNSVTNDGSFYTVEGIAALEDIVMDSATPPGHPTVLNNSWGGGPGSAGGEFDPLDQALINAAESGIFVSMSAGNAGPGHGTTDHPSPDYINVAAVADPGAYAAGQMNVIAPTPISPTLQGMGFGQAQFGPALPLGTTFTHTFRTSVSVDPTNFEGCSPWAEDDFEGVAAIISRGACFFGNKVYYAQEAGAEFVVIYNNDGDSVIDMSFGCDYSPDCSANDITIPSIFIGETHGNGMVDWYAEHGEDSVLEVDTVAFQVGDTEDVMASFSSRGPGVGNVLKPDIAAPGVSILAQGYGPGPGENRHLGYGQVSGTSMAAPHVAGSAALLRQVHPTWSNADIKSALMSTSVYTDVWNADGTPAQPLDMGAGRLDLTNAADPGVILDPPSVSFGQMVTGTNKTMTVSVTSVATATENYNLSTLYTGNGFAMTQTTPLTGFVVSPASITLDPAESTTISVTFTSTASMGVGNNQGYIILDGDNGHDAHMPTWARVVPEPSADVLVIDNDFSYLLGYPDYRDYYTDALDELGVSYDVWHADAYFGNSTTLPEAAILNSYDVVIYYTGDNFYPDGSFTVQTPLTEIDMNRLTQFANDGGLVIAMGQDASWVLDDSFFDNYVLGDERLQDSITNFGLPTQPIVPLASAPSAFHDVMLDLSGPSNYLGQISMPQARPALPETVYLPTVFGGGGPLPPAPTGSAMLAYDADGNVLDYSVTLSATVPFTLTASHIHEGGYFESGPVLYPLYTDGPTLVTDTFTFEGTAVISEAHEAALINGGLYINVHTTVRPASAVRAQTLLSPANNGANNQYYIDELAPDPNAAPNPVEGTVYPYAPLFTYPGPYNVEDGVVAIAHRDQPSLEYPGVSYYGRSIFTGFGLEGINNTPASTSRAELLDLFMKWGMDEPTVVISDVTGTYSPTTSLTVLEAHLSSNITGTTGVSYRWDFGDGSPYAGPYDTNIISHAYETCGDYTVRVEAVDSWGNHTIGTAEVEVTNCESGPADSP